MAKKILYVFFASAIFLSAPVEAVKYGYLIVDIKDKSSNKTFYIYRNKIRFDNRNAVPIQADKNMYEISSGAYELLRDEKVDSIDFDLVGKTLMSTKFKFKIKNDTVHFLGAIEMISSGKSKFQMKFHEDISLLKSTCNSHEDIMSKTPILFLNSNMPNKKFRFNCLNFSLSEW